VNGIVIFHSILPCRHSSQVRYCRRSFRAMPVECRTPPALSTNKSAFAASPFAAAASTVARTPFGPFFGLHFLVSWGATTWYGTSR